MSGRFLPLVGVLVLVGVIACWRPWLHFRRYGTWGIALFRTGSAGQRLRDGLGVVLFVLLVGQASVAAGWPESLTPRSAAAHPVLGGLFLVGGIGLLVTAQLHLGASWRIGIDDGRSPGLVTSGLYRFSRNPIFLALLVTLIGYTLLIPTRLSVLLLLGAYVGIRQQVSAEEAYLVRAYGEAYRDYARRVGRFVPGTGRLR